MQLHLLFSRTGQRLQSFTQEKGVTSLPYSLLPDEKKYSICIYDVAPLRMSSGYCMRQKQERRSFPRKSHNIRYSTKGRCSQRSAVRQTLFFLAPPCLYSCLSSLSNHLNDSLLCIQSKCNISRRGPTNAC
jgi:hypothetical protein